MKHLRLSVLVLCAVVPSCGGGGGGGAPPPPPPPLPDTPFFFMKGFDCSFTITSSVLDLAVDGTDLYVAGAFHAYRDTSSRGLIRLSVDGSVDLTYAFNGSVYSVAPDGTGDVYVGGAFTAPANRIVRLNADGSVDAAFATGTGFNSTVDEIVPAADGSGDVYVGGDFTSYNGTATNRIVRLNSDGSIDAAFAIGTGFTGSVRALAAGPGGTLYAGGWLTAYNGTAVTHLVRLNSDGSLDGAFAPAFNQEVRAIEVDPSGDVYAAGMFWIVNGASSPRLVRLNSDGTVDSAFAVGTGFGSWPVDSLALDASGDLYVGGEFTQYQSTVVAGIVRLDPNGAIDAAFDTGPGIGGALTLNRTIRAFAFAPDGDVWAGGYFATYKTTPVDHFLRLNPDGSIDGLTQTGAGFNYVVRAAVPAGDATGAMYVGGEFQWYHGTYVNHIARLLPDGSADPAFVTGTGFNQMVLSLAMSPAGLYVGGAFNLYNGSTAWRLARLLPTGAIDTAFSAGTGFNNDVRALAVAADGDLYVGGAFTLCNGTAVGRIVRLNPDGSIDAGFAAGAGFNGDVQAIALAPDGDVYVGGAFSTCDGASAPRIVRLNPDGTIDAAFATGAGFNSTVETMALDGSSLYVGGNFTSYDGFAAVRIARLGATGTLDSGFVTGSGFDWPVRSIVPTATRVYVGGVFTLFNGSPAPSIIALTTGGAADPGFATGTGFPRRVHAMALEGGDLYVGGEFSSYDGRTVDYFTALNSDGTLD